MVNYCLGTLLVAFAHAAGAFTSCRLSSLVQQSLPTNREGAKTPRATQGDGDTASPLSKLMCACDAACMGANKDQRPLVESMAKEVEALNPNPRPLEVPDLLSGCWRLVYTTSDSILGKSSYGCQSFDSCL